MTFVLVCVYKCVASLHFETIAVNTHRVSESCKLLLSEALTFLGGFLFFKKNCEQRCNAKLNDEFKALCI